MQKNNWPKGIRKSLDYPNKSLIEVFDEKVKQNSKKPYLSIKGITYSYIKVQELSLKFATILAEYNIKKGDNVALIMPNLPQFVFCFFGILRTGATVIPVSPLLGESDMKAVLLHTEAKIIIILDILFEKIIPFKDTLPLLEEVFVTSIGDILPAPLRMIAKLTKKLPPSPEIPGIKKLYPLLKKARAFDNHVKIDPNNDIAVLGITGGTTGIPKAAMLTHFNLVSNLYMAREWAIMVHPEGTTKKFVGAAPFFHIIGLTAVMLVTMFFDSTVYLFPDPRQIDSILQTIEKEQLNYFHGVPTLFRAIIKHPAFQKYDISSLDIVFSGAAPLTEDIQKAFEARIRGMMIEAYGMTETSPIIAANPFERENRKIGSIGIPFIDTEIKIVDLDSGVELEQGKIGEIIVKGPQVMKGYYKLEQDTKEILNNGYLHTGDVGFIDENGFITLVSRKKEMINVSGFKVFPAELEKYILSEITELEDAVVIPQKDEYQGESIKLIGVLKPGIQITKEEIVERLKQKVAPFKVPKYIEFRRELPKTAVGKIDRRTLIAEAQR
jgi:long-chain acyl-CoA synthetase